MQTSDPSEASEASEADPFAALSAEEAPMNDADGAHVHEMRVAFPGREVARRRGLNRNHHVRVWCTCMEGALYPAGTFSLRSVREARNDPRRLGMWDDLGYVDVRVPGSALALWKAHVEQEEGGRDAAAEE